MELTYAVIFILASVGLVCIIFEIADLVMRTTRRGVRGVRVEVSVAGDSPLTAGCVARIYDGLAGVRAPEGIEFAVVDDGLSDSSRAELERLTLCRGGIKLYERSEYGGRQQNR